MSHPWLQANKVEFAGRCREAATLLSEQGGMRHDINVVDRAFKRSAKVQARELETPGARTTAVVRAAVATSSGSSGVSEVMKAVAVQGRTDWYVDQITLSLSTDRG